MSFLETAKISRLSSESIRTDQSLRPTHFLFLHNRSYIRQLRVPHHGRLPQRWPTLNIRQTKHQPRLCKCPDIGTCEEPYFLPRLHHLQNSKQFFHFLARILSNLESPH